MWAGVVSILGAVAWSAGGEVGSGSVASYPQAHRPFLPSTLVSCLGLKAGPLKDQRLETGPHNLETILNLHFKKVHQEILKNIFLLILFC